MKNAKIKGSLNHYSDCRNWPWLGKQTNTEVRYLDFLFSVPVLFERSEFSHVMQSQNAVLITCVG